MLDIWVEGGEGALGEEEASSALVAAAEGALPEAQEAAGTAAMEVDEQQVGA